MDRVFIAQDQLSFAELSGDYNPIHVDPLAARRLMFGRPVVHGIHAVLWALDRFFDQQIKEDSSRFCLRGLSVEFFSPMLVDDKVGLTIVTPNRLELSCGGNSSATIEFSLEPAVESVAVAPTLPEKLPCREVSPAEVKNITGRLPLHLNAQAASKLFPALNRSLVASQFAALLATTRLVGMELPGLHSLYTGIDLKCSDELKEPVLAYAVEGRDQQSAMLLILAVKAPGFAGKLSAAFRPAPTKQADMTQFRQLVKPDEFRGQRALVIGGSRGLGEVAVKSLIAGGADVRFTYYKGAEDAERIVADIRVAGGSASCFAFDSQSDSAKLPQLLGDWRPTLLCYFATPTISSTVPNHFQSDRFAGFCRIYVDGFLDTFNAIKSDLRGVLYPSSSAIDELPSNMGEYAAAKVAAENLCHFLAKTNPGVRFHTPRYSRLATDQTATVISVATGDAKAVVLESLRLASPSSGTPGEGRGEDVFESRKPSVIRNHSHPSPLPEYREREQVTGPSFAVAATFTGEPIEPFLKFWMSEIGQPGQVEFAPYNQIFQSMLEPAGLMSRKNFANAILIRLEDWIEGDKSALDAATWKAKLSPLIAELVSAAGALSRPAPTLVVVCPPSTKVIANSQVAGVLDELESELVGALKTVPGVYAFSAQSISANYRVTDYYSPSGDAVGKIPYTTKYFAALGTFLARSALAVRRSPFKVIVLDCDNTLWSGVCGEGGVSAVSVGPGFRAMQEFMANQTAQGKVICLCSKNTESDVWDIFDNHPGMLLKRGQIVAHRINWSPKSENLRELAKELNLGLDSFIFLDDNPVECAEVRSSCPQVLTLQAPARGEDWPQFLKHVWAFDQLKVTDQDLKRAASYQQNSQREAIRKESAGLDDFLAKLDLRVEIKPVTPANMARVAQLTERTNQFNFSTIRRSEAEIIGLLKNPQYHCDTVEVKDRFGDYGLVGIMITCAEANALVVDTMLLSCRVLGRGVEHRMLASLGERAKSLGLAQVQIPFVRSEKNQPALDFLNGAVGDYRSDAPNGFAYRIPADVSAVIKAKVISAPPVETEKESSSSTTKPATAAVPYQRIADEFRDVDAIVAVVSGMPVVSQGSAPLKNIVAELLAIAPEQLGPDRMLSGARLPGSLGRAILDAALRERLGIECAAVYTVKTYGELEAAVNGVAGAKPAPADSNGSHERKPATVDRIPPQSTKSLPRFSFPSMPQINGGASVACGVDMELIENLPAADDYGTHEFYTAHFSAGEIAYCLAQQSPVEHFAARWSAKEALKKCEPSLMGEQMRNIEVFSRADGSPSLRHLSNGSSVDLPHSLSLSHTSVAAVAVVARASSSASVAQAPVAVPIVKRLKQIVKRCIALVLPMKQEATAVNSLTQATLLPGAVMLPEAVIENLSGRKETIVIGEHSYIRGRLLTYPNAGSITIGSWSYIGHRSEVWAMADMKIGDRVLIAHNVTILDCSGHSRNAEERHAHFRAIVTTGHPKTWEELPGMSAQQIVIEDDVWIGSGVSILPGVRIGARSIVASGATVNVDIPPDSIYSNEPKSRIIANYS